jgi:hypothetical protein
MLALVLEVYGAFCLFSLVAFLVLAVVARLRPELEEDEFDVELWKLKELATSDQSGEVLSLEPPIMEGPYWSPPARPAKRSKRRIQRRPHLFHIPTPRTT